MNLVARRVFRLAVSVSVALGFAYAVAVPLPFMAPLFALLLTVMSPRPLGLKGLAGMLVLVLVTTGIGLLMVQVLLAWPATGLLLIGLGIFLSNYISMTLKKGAVGSFLIVGLTIKNTAGANYHLPVASFLQFGGNSPRGRVLL